MIALRVAALAVLYFACFAAVAAALLPPAPGTPASDPVAAACSLLVMTASNSIVIAYVVRRSRWSGWPLAAAFWVVLYGVTTVMPQIETAYFVTRLPTGMLPRLFVSGAIVAAVVSPLAVRLLGRWRRGATGESPLLRLTARGIRRPLRRKRAKAYRQGQGISDAITVKAAAKQSFSLLTQRENFYEEISALGLREYAGIQGRHVESDIIRAAAGKRANSYPTRGYPSVSYHGVSVAYAGNPA
jgi:hypothetical protein